MRRQAPESYSIEEKLVNEFRRSRTRHATTHNASIARLLVRDLIPAVAAGSTMEDVVTARFDYNKLDLAKSAVQIRLNSTVTHVANVGDPEAAEQVRVSYVQSGQAYTVRARSSVLACNNAMIPSICPELSEPQHEALALQVRAPILYTTVALRNWQAWNKLGVGAVVAPGSCHVNAMLESAIDQARRAVAELV